MCLSLTHLTKNKATSASVAPGAKIERATPEAQESPESTCVCVCVCVWEGEREREREREREGGNSDL